MYFECRGGLFFVGELVVDHDFDEVVVERREDHLNGVFLRIGCEVIDDEVASHHIESANGVLQLKYVVVFAYDDVLR